MHTSMTEPIMRCKQPANWYKSNAIKSSNEEKKATKEKNTRRDVAWPGPVNGMSEIFKRDCHFIFQLKLRQSKPHAQGNDVFIR